MKLSFNRNPAGSYRTRIGDLSITLDKEFVPASAGGTLDIEVMLTRALYPRDAHGNVNFQAHPYGYLARPVTPDDVLVEHNGFEEAGSACATTASAEVWGIPFTLTPGRMHGGGVYVADNVNTHYYKSPPAPKVPGLAYANRNKIGSGVIVRMEGVPSLEETDYFIRRLCSNQAVREWQRKFAEWETERDARMAQRRQERQQSKEV